MSGSEDIQIAVREASERMDELGRQSRECLESVRTALVEFAEVTTATSRSEPGEALASMTRAAELAERLAALGDRAVEQGDEYLMGV